MKEKKLVFGVGFNDTDYRVQECESWRENGKLKRKLVWACPYYKKWVHMLERCYSERIQQKQPTYRGCYVYEPWLTFSNFKSWMEQQEWGGMQLDKDILCEGNKEYCPDKCVFVPREVNNFLTAREAVRGNCKIGVTVNHSRRTNPYRARCGNPITKEYEHLGYFPTEQEAYNTYKKRKYEVAIELANSKYVTDDRVKNALIGRFKY